MKYPVGSIITFNSKKGGWFSSAQRFFTRKPYTHSAVVFPDELGVPSFFGADMAVDKKPVAQFENNTTVDYQVWEWVGIPKRHIEAVLREIYVTFAGETYDFLQVLWFVYRWFMEVFLHKDVRKRKNWFATTKHPICSELTWNVCQLMTIDNPVCQSILHEWSPETFHSGDQAEVMQRFEKLGVVRKVYERWDVSKK
jgi:hypothetical protein